MKINTERLQIAEANTRMATETAEALQKQNLELQATLRQQLSASASASASASTSTYFPSPTSPASSPSNCISPPQGKTHRRMNHHDMSAMMCVSELCPQWDTFALHAGLEISVIQMIKANSPNNITSQYMAMWSKIFSSQPMFSTEMAMKAIGKTFNNDSVAQLDIWQLFWGNLS